MTLVNDPVSETNSTQFILIILSIKIVCGLSLSQGQYFKHLMRLFLYKIIYFNPVVFYQIFI